MFQQAGVLDRARAHRRALAESLGEPRAANIIWRAQNDIAVDGEAAEKVVKLVDALDDVDDVQNVYANFDISDEVLE